MIETRLQQFAARFERWSLTAELQRRGLPAAPLSTVTALAANPHLVARQFFRAIEQPPWGQLHGPGPLFRTTATPLEVRRPAPRLGEHQEEVLAPGRASQTASICPHTAMPASPAARGGRWPLAGVRVVVENFSPRVMAQYAIDYQHLRTVKPDIIMASRPGFGQSGPHSAFVSYGGPLMVYTGMALLWGHPESPLDARSKIAYPDYIAAGTLALAVIAALHHRARTGQGQHIEIAQVEATAAAMAVAFFDYFANGTIATPRGNRDPHCVPQGCYPCQGHDAWMALSCTNDAQWRALAQLIGDAELAHAPQYATTAARWQRHDALDALISAWTQQCTPLQAMRLLQAAGVPAGMVQTGQDLWRDVHLRARCAIVTLEHAEIGTVEHTSLTVRLHGTPGQIRRPLGRLGEANADVFCGLLGLSQEELAHLVAAGVIA